MSEYKHFLWLNSVKASDIVVSDFLINKISRLATQEEIEQYHRLPVASERELRWFYHMEHFHGPPPTKWTPQELNFLRLAAAKQIVDKRVRLLPTKGNGLDYDFDAEGYAHVRKI